MGEQRRVQLNVFGGESAHQNAAIGRVTSRTVGWVPNQEGKLTTWRGVKQVLAGTNGPALWANQYMRNAKFFTDVFGRRRLVAHVDDAIYAVDGNDVVKLFEYPPDIDTDDGGHHVSFVEHQNHVIILHPNFPPLKWGGDEPVSWLGVRDIPTQPDVHAARTWGRYFQYLQTWGIQTANYKPPVFLQHDDATGPASRAWKYKAAFMNSRGQIGRWGASSYIELAPTSGNQLFRMYPIVEWTRPTDQGPDFRTPQQTGAPTGNGTDITHVVIARTGDVIADPDAGIFLVQGVYPYTMNHVTDGTPDAGLSLSIEEDNFPPQNASFGCVFKDTLLISGNLADPYGVWWSKPGFMESFPPLNYYKAIAKVTAVIPLSDRVVIVTEESIEVLRQADSGFFGRFRVESRKGSKYGNSIIEYKGSLFGIFDGGFGVFDGFSFKGMADEYGELFDFISMAQADRIRGHIDTSGRYWLTVNYADSDDASGNGLVFMYDFTFNAWFRVSETATCIFEEAGELYFGALDNFYLVDAGTGGADVHVLEFAATFMERQNPQFGLIHKKVNNVYLRIASTGDYTGTVKLFADEMLESPVAEGTFDTNLGRPGLTDAKTDSVWGVAALDADAQWDSPRVGWQKVKLKEPVDFYSLRVQVSIPAKSYAEISGIAMDLHLEDVQTPL